MADRGTKPTTRLHVLKARSADKAVIFRQGPRTLWQMWLWDMAKDNFIPGQWYRGEVGVDGSDVSDDGQYVVLALTKGYRRVEAGSWEHRIAGKHTVISRPPYFTALAYFPAEGDDLRLGGHFSGKREVSLYGKAWSDECKVLSGCPFQFREEARGREEWETWESEGWTIEFWEGLDREWVRANAGYWDRRTPAQYKRVPEGVDRKYFRDLGIQFQASMSAHRLTWRVVRGMRPLRAKSGYWLSVGEEKPVRIAADWTGFDRRGRALVVRGAQVIEVKREGGEFVESVLGDLTDSEFEEVVAPEWALHWKKR